MNVKQDEKRTRSKESAVVETLWKIGKICEIVGKPKRKEVRSWSFEYHGCTTYPLIGDDFPGDILLLIKTQNKKFSKDIENSCQKFFLVRKF